MSNPQDNQESEKPREEATDPAVVPDEMEASGKWAKVSDRNSKNVAIEEETDSDSEASNDGKAPEEHGFGPGMCDDGRPRYIDMDWVEFKAMVERRSDEALAKFGGLQAMAEAFKSHPERGIDHATWQARVDQFGENLLSKKEPATFLEFLLEAFSDQIVMILCAAAIVSIIFGLTLPDPHSGEVEYSHGWIEGVAIIISILLVTLTGSINNYQKAKRFEEMEREQAVKDVQVVREGKEVTIKSDTIVPGDILVLETGMELSVDGLFISGSDIKVNESALTGEPDMIEKNADHAWFISGTSVEEGNGRILVVGIGMGSFQGTLKSELDGEAEETPLQEHLGELADKIGTVGLSGAIFLVLALSLKEVILIGNGTNTANASTFLNFVLVSITLIAVAIPEGLPLAVTIALAFSMKAMMKEQCMVRVLASCETMGAATAICSDKTGTLTTNEMTVVQALVMEDEFIIDGYGLTARPGADVFVVPRTGDGSAAVFGNMRSSNDNIDKIAFAVTINSTARESVINDKLTWIGNKTEQGILKFVKSSGRDYEAIRNSVPLENVRQYPFSSEKKRMTTIVRDRDGVLTAYFKGASEAILAMSSRFLDANAVPVDLNDSKRTVFDAVIGDMATQGNRTIGVAYAVLEGVKEFPEEEPNVAATFMGVLGIQDPIKSAVPTAVLQSQAAGVTVRMVTGDNIHTAIAIAKKCNIYRENGHDHAMTGPDFRDMYMNNRARLIELLPRIRVLARSSPKDKHILVGLLQDEMGDVVGVTGDGTNDAPALKLADVGFAMEAGTDIAKGASDMVLLDNNFATVVTAIRWGRAVNDNIRKFLQYQLAINVAGVGLTLVGSLASSTSKEPFTPVQLLWLNLIMDTLAAIALATELPDDACLERTPVFKQAPLVSNNMRLFVGIHGIYQIFIILLLLFLGQHWFKTIDGPGYCDTYWPPLVNSTNPITYIADPRQADCEKICKNKGGTYERDDQTCRQGGVHSTLIFNIFIWMQIFNVFNARKIHGEVNMMEGMQRSQNLVFAFAAIIALQVLAVEVFGDFISTVGLSGKNWGITFGFAATEWVVGLIQRLIPVKDYVPTDEERKEARRVEKEAEQEKEKKEAEAKKEEKRQRKIKRREERAAALSGGHPAPDRASEKSAGKTSERKGTFRKDESSLRHTSFIVRKDGKDGARRKSTGPS